MKFKLGRLPSTILLEVLSYTHPEEILDHRFLNKRVFEIASNIIHNHLRYTFYHNSNNFKAIQDDFIKKNTTNIVYLNIYLTHLIEFPSLFNHDNVISSDKFKNLKSLDIQIVNNIFSNEHSRKLEIFKEFFFKVETFKLNAWFGIELNVILLLLNPKVIKSLSIFVENLKLTMNNILKFKEFTILEQLTLDPYRIEIESNDSITNDTIIFPLLKSLTIKGDYNSIIKYKLSGNVNNLMFVDLLFENDLNYIQLIKGKTLSTNVNLKYKIQPTFDIILDSILGKLESVLEVPCNITMKISGLKDILEYGQNNTVEYHVEDILESFTDYLEVFQKIHVLKFHDCCFSINSVMKLLKCFPNLSKVKFFNCSISKSTQTPFLRLPNNTDNILFFIDNLTKSESSSAIDKFRANTNAHVFYYKYDFDV